MLLEVFDLRGGAEPRPQLALQEQQLGEELNKVFSIQSIQHLTGKVCGVTFAVFFITTGGSFHVEYVPPVGGNGGGCVLVTAAGGGMSLLTLGMEFWNVLDDTGFVDG